jgi:hypothetical protein
MCKKKICLLTINYVIPFPSFILSTFKHNQSVIKPADQTEKVHENTHTPMDMFCMRNRMAIPEEK